LGASVCSGLAQAPKIINDNINIIFNLIVDLNGVYLLSILFFVSSSKD